MAYVRGSPASHFLTASRRRSWRRSWLRPVPGSSTTLSWSSMASLAASLASAAGLVRPVAALMPGGIVTQDVRPLAAILLVCFIVGVAMTTPMRQQIERVVFERLPGYGLIRSLTQRLSGQGDETAWKPALVEIEEAGFIIEEHEDGQYTVFVPSVPTPFAGAVYS